MMEVVNQPEPEPEPPTLTEVFVAEESRLLHFAHGYVKRRAVAEEMVQEAFLRLHREWEQVRHPRAWLFRTVRNLSLNHIRKHRRETTVEKTPEPESPDSGAAPDQELLRVESIGRLRLHLAELKPEDRELVRLKYQEDLSYRAIGERLGISIGNVGYRLHHLLKDLAAKMKETDH